MDIIDNVFSNIEFLKPQTYENITTIGIKTNNTNNLDILSLEKGLELDLIKINEISDAGSVNDLKVKNESNIPLLILDGEELLGAKQNRILNTTVLIPPNTEQIVPVSCTEQGRWRYNSPSFKKSENIASGKLRYKKSNSVYNSLKTNKSFTSNQSEVWDEVAELGCLFGTESNTSALSDTFEDKKQDINQYLKELKYTKEQTGVITFINNEIANLELVYNTSLYKNYHEKIIKSNIIDGLSSNLYEKQSNTILLDNADKFINDIKDETFEGFDSIGLGKDYRLNNPIIRGSFLGYNDSLMHGLFFNSIKFKNNLATSVVVE